VKYKNIIWDWNGTILDDALIFVDVMNSILSTKNLPHITLEQYQDNFDFPISNYYNYLGINDLDSYNDISNIFIKKYKKKIYVSKMMPGVFQLIKMFHKKKINQFILSASHKNILFKQTKYYKINYYMNQVIGLDNYFAKGKKEIGINWLKQSNFIKNECLYIGDTVYDYKISLDMGIDSIMISKGHNSRHRLVEVGANVIDDFKEIIF